MPSVRCSPPLTNPRLACARESGSPRFLAQQAEKFNCDLPSGMIQGTAEIASFLRGLRLADLDLAATFQSRVQE